MTLMVPDAKFSLGASSTTAASSSGAGGVDVSLDDMIKNRRKDQMSRSRKGAAARKPSAADRVQGRGRAKRQAAINARRGIQNASSTNKPTAMEMEREVYRQSHRSARAKESSLRKASGGRLPKSRATRKSQTNKQQQGKAGQKTSGKNSLDSASAVQTPAWVAGTRRPPSRKAVTAAVSAMSDAGFRVPKGMQMVISFAPAPETDPNQNPALKQKKGANNKGKGKKPNTSNKGSGRRK